MSANDLTVADVARILRRDRATIYAMLAEGRIGGVTEGGDGKSWRFDPVAFEEWRRSRVRPLADPNAVAPRSAAAQRARTRRAAA